MRELFSEMPTCKQIEEAKICNVVACKNRLLYVFEDPSLGDLSYDQRYDSLIDLLTIVYYTKYYRVFSHNFDVVSLLSELRYDEIDFSLLFALDVDEFFGVCAAVKSCYLSRYYDLDDEE